MTDLRSPYPWFGGKSRIASLVWQRFGDVRNYVEPFFGSGAVLLARPELRGTETVNDLNGWLCNFWRALQADPDGVAAYADWPVSELDLHARGDWLFYREDALEFVERLRSDPDYYDLKSAGWWVWGLGAWIGSGWGREEEKVKRRVSRQLPVLGNAGVGIHRTTLGVARHRPHLGDAGQGIHRSTLNNGETAEGPATVKGQQLLSYFRGLSDRMRSVRISCGDWSRVCGTSPTVKLGLTGVFLDPPYAVKDRYNRCYGDEDDREIAHVVREWAIEHGDDKRMRIALCGYDEHAMPDSWECVPWKANGGYGLQAKGNSAGRANARRERIWFSPHCVPAEQSSLLEQGSQ